MEKEQEEKIKKVFLDAISKIEIIECEVCHAFISRKEFEEGEGACFKCWGNGNLN